VACGSSAHHPDDAEAVHLIGRFDPQQRFAWPGTQIATRFTGSSIAVDLEDSGKNWFVATIDGKPQPAFVAPAGRATVTLATGLSPGMHDLVLARRTEAQLGPTTFHGFPGAALVATPRPTRWIEIIGDSITCGYGVLGTSDCTFSPDTEDETSAWGALAAADLHAAHVAISYSGIGIYRDYTGDATKNMPDRYGRVVADDPSSTWTWSYRPDVIVIELGTNDFNRGNPGQPYVDAYISFVRMLRGRFPAAAILLATSPMAGGDKRVAMKGVLLAVLAAMGDEHISIVDLAEQLADDGYGCDRHPSTKTQRKMADALVAAIRGSTGW
jgi:lysophospholipase L1-like esterase